MNSSSWLCPIGEGPKPGCIVYTGFVIGGNGYDPKRKQWQKLLNSTNGTIVDRNQSDVVVLDIQENMNNGKSWAWFHNASRMYPWATHIGKMDDDTYPYFAELLRRVNQTQGQNLSYIGVPRQNPKTLIYHMLGALYVMSRTLAVEISSEGDYWDLHHKFIEDRTTGQAIDKFKNDTGRKVFTVDCQRKCWFHIGNNPHVFRMRQCPILRIPGSPPTTLDMSSYGISLDEETNDALDSDGNECEPWGIGLNN